MHGLKIRFSLSLAVLTAAAAALLWMTSGSPRAQAQTMAVVPAQDTAQDAPQVRGRAGFQATPGVYTQHVTAHWFAGNTKFWYRNELPEEKSEFILVDVEAGKRGPAFDQAKLAAGLSKAAGAAYDGAKLPFAAIEFTADEKFVRFTVGETTWRCELASYDCTKDTGAPVTTRAALGAPMENVPAAWAEEDGVSLGAPQVGGGPGGRGRGPGQGLAPADTAAPAVPVGPVTSPDGKWTARVQNNNIVLGPAGGPGGAGGAPISTDGSAADSYCYLSFSPDSSTLLAYRMQPGDHKLVYLTESTPPGPVGTVGGGVGRAVLLERPYALAGDKFDSFEMNVFNVSTKKQTKPAVERIDMDAGGGDPVPDARFIRWKADGYHFTFEKYDRGHQRVRVIEGDAHSGALRNIIDETAKTFIWTAHADQEGWRLLSYLPNDEIMYCSEIDGWRHYYLVDAKTPAGDFAGAKPPEMKQITKGNWTIRGTDDARDRMHPAIDTANRVLYFTASGIYPDQDPYLIHYGHVNFDGTGLVWMTQGNGNHTITYSPDYKYIIDSYDRADFAGATELRRVSDGKLVCELEKTDVQTPWNKPEVFTAKGRDGATDIWGVIYKPKGFDPSKKYPVIENIYAGPHGNFVPKTFSLTPPRSSRDGNMPGSDERLLDLGFVIVHIDGMGTAHRSRAFHDVCWQNLMDAGFPDRIAWMKAAAQTRPYMDLTRVGIFGTSAGGQSAAAALLTHPEFYKVAVANSGCHDNRMDKASWNEQWMGYPVGPQYAANSNIENAAKLQGRLQLVVGELDTNVPPESTNRLVDALIKANKSFEYVMVPGADHGALMPGESIVPGKLTSFFARYLEGVEVENPNLVPGKPPVPSTGPGPAPAGGRGRGG